MVNPRNGQFNSKVKRNGRTVPRKVVGGIGKKSKTSAWPKNEMKSMEASRNKKKASLPTPRENKIFKEAFDDACGSSGTVYNFGINWSAGFIPAARILWLSLFKRNAFSQDITFAHFVTYLNRCYAWYLFHHGNWENSDNNIPGCGTYYLPKGLALIFSQSSKFVHERKEYTVQAFEVSPPSVIQIDWPSAWFGNQNPDWTGTDYRVNPSAIAVNDVDITVDTMAFMSTMIRNCFKGGVVEVQNVKWGAVSAELFPGYVNSGLSKIYTWSTGMTPLVPIGKRFVGFRMTYNSSDDLKHLILDFLLNSLNGATSVANCIQFNGYDPMMIDTEALDPESHYLAQMIAEHWIQIGGTAADFRSYVSFCWSYVASYFCNVALARNIFLLSNPAFRKFKVPWYLIYAAKNSINRSGSTFQFLYSTGRNWSDLYQGAGSDVLWSVTTFGHPGYLSNSVPGVVTIAPGVIVTATVPNMSAFSWSNAANAYKYLWDTYAQLSNMSVLMDETMNDCSCFGIFGSTTFVDPISNSVLGTLQPHTILELECSSKLPVGLCMVAAAFTWRTNKIVGSSVALANVGSSIQVSSMAGALATVMATTITQNATTVTVLRSAIDGIGNYVYEQLSGGYDYQQYTKDKCVDMLVNWVVGNATVVRLTDKAITALAKNLPDKVSIDTLAMFMAKIGWAGIDAVATVVAKKKIGFSKMVRVEF